MKPVLCPSPRALVQSGGGIDAPARIRVGTADAGQLSRAAEVSAAILGGICKVAIDPDAAFAVDVGRDPALCGEAYRLSCGPEGCEIRAGTAQGVSRAFATLAQLFIGGQIPALDIRDAPALPLRGYMLDASRDRVPARRTLLHILDALWLCKYNQFQLYVEHT
ncbi:MAG: glycoside hydrolase family 20 zincin-like fold domain-containing protein, partial [Opitutales bacterium]